MTKFKFQVFNFAGDLHSLWVGEQIDLSSSAPVKKRQPAHHCMIVDASGSMSGDIVNVRSTMEKICTLDEYGNPDLRLSLISFSSHGDVKLHFAKVTVADVMKANSPYLKEIRSLHTRCMTGISQSLKMAESIVDDKEMTAVSLHTDGFANDPSPMMEHRTIEELITRLRAHPNLFVNTIGYRDWCDYNLLAKIANSLSGTCVQAKSLDQVYNALSGTTQLVAGSMAPTLELSKGDAEYVIFCSTRARKVLGASETIAVRGLAADDDKIGYRLRQVKPAEYNKAPETKGLDTMVMLAFSRCQLAEGSLNFSKYLMTSSLVGQLRRHSRALVSADIAAMAADLERYLFDSLTMKFESSPALASDDLSILDLFDILNEHPDGFLLNLPELRKNYTRRGLKRLEGTRENGVHTLPWTDTKFRDDSEWVETHGFELNNADATINVLIARPVDLIERATNKRIGEVAGVKINDLKAYNNYTIVSDGMLNVKELKIRVTDEELFDKLKAVGQCAGLIKFDPKVEVTMYLDTAPLVDYGAKFKDIEPAMFQNLLKFTVLQKALKAICAEEKPRFTPEQIAELKRHHITPALYYSPPTCNPYDKLEDALVKGEVDYRMSYQVKLGSKECLHLGQLYSANEYLQRRFTLSIAGTKVDKPTWAAWSTDRGPLRGAKWEIKELSARTKLNNIDEITFPIYAGLLQLDSGNAGADLEELLDEVLPKKYSAKIRTALFSKLDIEGARDALKFVEKKIEQIYSKHLRPLVFYVGASGIVPDSLNAKALTAEQFEQKYNEKLGKNEKEGTFFILPNDLVLSVFTESKLFSI